MSEVVARGRDEMIAQWLIKNGGDPGALFDAEAQAKLRESEHLLAAMGILSPSGGDDEPFDLKDERRRLLGRILGDSAGPEDDRPRRRLSGSLAPRPPEPAAEEDGPAARPAAKPEEEAAGKPEPKPSAAAPEERRSRVRGVQQQKPLSNSGRGARVRDPDADGS
jgi:hypothetical protein